VTALAFSPDGAVLVVGSQAGVEMRSWPGLEPAGTIETELDHVDAIRFSPAGDSLALAGGVPADGGSIEIARWPGGESAWRAAPQDDLIYGVAWRGDGRTIATGSIDRTVAVLDTANGDVLRRIEGHSRGVMAVAYLAEPELLLSAGIDQSIRVWQPDNSDALRNLDNHTQPVYDLVLRPGQPEGTLPMVVSVSEDRTMRLWQPTIGRLVRFLRLDSAPLAVTWTPDGLWIVAVAKDGHVYRVDPDTVEVLERIPAVDGWAYSLAMHPTGREVAVGGEHGELRRVAIGSATP